MIRAAERELASIARRLPIFVDEESAGGLLGISARHIRRKVTSGELARGAAGTVTRVSLLALLARRQRLDLDELELVLQALEEPPAAPPLKLVPGGVGTVRSATTTDSQGG
jgi:hypothetical protein